MKLPFKEVHPVLPDNFRNSVAILGSLLRRLKQDPEVLQEYNAVFMEQSVKGMIEDVTDKMLPAGGCTLYSPSCSNKAGQRSN